MTDPEPDFNPPPQPPEPPNPFKSLFPYGLIVTALIGCYTLYSAFVAIGAAFE